MAKKKTTSPVVEPKLLDIKSAAVYLASHPWQLRTLVWERKIPFIKLGNKYVFDRKDLDEFVDAQKTAVAQ